MNNISNIEGNRKYFITIDILKGFAIFPMIFAHILGWWNLPMVLNYEESNLIVIIIMVLGLMVFPCFLFVYGFNQVNSFLKKGNTISDTHELRSRALKRSMIFLIFAVVSMGIMSFARGEPERILNYILTWHLFHLFAVTTIFLLLMWEFSCWIENKNPNSWQAHQYLALILFSGFILIIILFFLSHDYTSTQTVTFPVSLELGLIIQYAILDISTTGIIPWLTFALAGGLTATILNLFSDHQENIHKKSLLLLIIYGVILITGLVLLKEERFVSYALGLSSSFSHVFISIGTIGCVIIILLLILDVNKTISHRVTLKLLYPIIIISKITLTVYIIHPVFSFINPSVFPSELTLLLFISLYSVFFIVLAHFWQKWDYKYSFEWFIQKYS